MIFEQLPVQRMEYFEKAFGIHTAGGDRDPQAVDPDLKARLTAAGLTDDLVAKVPLYNTHEKLPPGSRVLLRGKRGSVGGVVAPFGKGRLILMGTDLDGPREAILNPAVLDLLLPAGPTAVTPAGGDLAARRDGAAGTATPPTPGSSSPPAARRPPPAARWTSCRWSIRTRTPSAATGGGPRAPRASSTTASGPRGT